MARQQTFNLCYGSSILLTGTYVGIIQRIEYESSKLTTWVRFPVPILYVVGSLMVKPVIVAHET